MPGHKGSKGDKGDAVSGGPQGGCVHGRRYGVALALCFPQNFGTYLTKAESAKVPI